MPLQGLTACGLPVFCLRQVRVGGMPLEGLRRDYLAGASPRTPMLLARPCYLSRVWLYFRTLWYLICV
jgi:hypothetical protein